MLQPGDEVRVIASFVGVQSTKSVILSKGQKGKVLDVSGPRGIFVRFYNGGSPNMSKTWVRHADADLLAKTPTVGEEVVVRDDFTTTGDGPPIQFDRNSTSKILGVDDELGLHLQTEDGSSSGYVCWPKIDHLKLVADERGFNVQVHAAHLAGSHPCNLEYSSGYLEKLLWLQNPQVADEASQYLHNSSVAGGCGGGFDAAVAKQLGGLVGSVSPTEPTFNHGNRPQPCATDATGLLAGPSLQSGENPREPVGRPVFPASFGPPTCDHPPQEPVARSRFRTNANNSGFAMPGSGLMPGAPIEASPIDLSCTGLRTAMGQLAAAAAVGAPPGPYLDSAHLHGFQSGNRSFNGIMFGEHAAVRTKQNRGATLSSEFTSVAGQAMGGGCEPTAFRPYRQGQTEEVRRVVVTWLGPIGMSLIGAPGLPPRVVSVRSSSPLPAAVLGTRLASVDKTDVTVLTRRELATALQRRPLALSFDLVIPGENVPEVHPHAALLPGHALVSRQASVPTLYYEVEFAAGIPLGHELDPKRTVKYVKSGWHAELEGMRIGDVLVTVDGLSASLLPAATTLLRLQRRPLVLGFSKASASMGTNAGEVGLFEFVLVEGGATGIIPGCVPPEPVVIKTVVDGSPAKMAGFRAGDVVLSANSIHAAVLTADAFDQVWLQRPLTVKVLRGPGVRAAFYHSAVEVVTWGSLSMQGCIGALEAPAVNWGATTSPQVPVDGRNATNLPLPSGADRSGFDGVWIHRDLPTIREVVRGFQVFSPDGAVTELQLDGSDGFLMRLGEQVFRGQRVGDQIQFNDGDVWIFAGHEVWAGASAGTVATTAVPAKADSGTPNIKEAPPEAEEGNVKKAPPEAEEGGGLDSAMNNMLKLRREKRAAAETGRPAANGIATSAVAKRVSAETMRPAAQVANANDGEVTEPSAADDTTKTASGADTSLNGVAHAHGGEVTAPSEAEAAATAASGADAALNGDPVEVDSTEKPVPSGTAEPAPSGDGNAAGALSALLARRKKKRASMMSGQAS